MESRGERLHMERRGMGEMEEEGEIGEKGRREVERRRKRLHMKGEEWEKWERREIGRSAGETEEKGQIIYRREEK